MLLSAALALIFPFELFLFSIIILGPLHYLTEISWLEKRNFFVQSKSNIIFLILLGIAVILPNLDKHSPLTPYQTPLLAATFVYAIGLIMHKNFGYNFSYFVIALVLGIAFNISKMSWASIIFAVLLPTMIHVLLFTGIFLLSGAVKNKTKAEYIQLLVFIACIAAIMLPAYSFNWYSVSKGVKELYILPLAIVNGVLSKMFGTGQLRSINDVFVGAAQMKIMALIAFAYTYHYLNWFSKTTVIKWHEVSKPRLVGIIVIWAIVVLACVWDYEKGFLLLSFLSLMHVILEFPLNIKAMGDIGRSFSSESKMTKA